MSALVRAVHSEWTKLRTVRSTGWLLLGLVTGTVLVGLLVGSSGFEGEVDEPRLALSGVYVGQVAAAVLGVLVVGSEYAAGTMSTTIAAQPRRWLNVVAKLLVVLAPVLAAAALAVGGSLLIGHIGLSSLAVRAAGGTVLYLGLIALLGVGAALVLRNTAAAIAVVLMLLFAFPILGSLVSDPDWREWLTEWAPMTAGLAIQTTRDLSSLPVGPWEGLAVLASYSGVAVVLGVLLFERRDA